MGNPEPAEASTVDKPTLVALALCAYAIANVAHEGLGHGGACVLVGGTPVELNAVYFDCDEETITLAASRWVSAGGTLVNFVVAALGWIALRATARRPTPTRYFFWLLMTLSLLQGTGYWLFSGIGNVGDWAHVIEGQSPAWLWRVLLAVVGAAGYGLTVLLSLRTLTPLLGRGEARVKRAQTLALVPYLAGGALYVIAALMNRLSPMLVLVSGAAASFGGASALAWMHNLLRAPRWFPAGDDAPLALPRSKLVIALGALCAAAFIGVLGRGVLL